MSTFVHSSLTMHYLQMRSVNSDHRHNLSNANIHFGRVMCNVADMP